MLSIYHIMRLLECCLCLCEVQLKVGKWSTSSSNCPQGFLSYMFSCGHVCQTPINCVSSTTSLMMFLGSNQRKWWQRCLSCHHSEVEGMLEACDYILLVLKEIQTHCWWLSRQFMEADALHSSLQHCSSVQKNIPRLIGSGREKKTPTSIVWVSVRVILYWSLFSTCLRRKCLCFWFWIQVLYLQLMQCFLCKLCSQE